MSPQQCAGNPLSAHTAHVHCADSLHMWDHMFDAGNDTHRGLQLPAHVGSSDTNPGSNTWTTDEWQDGDLVGGSRTSMSSSSDMASHRRRACRKDFRHLRHHVSTISAHTHPVYTHMNIAHVHQADALQIGKHLRTHLKALVVPFPRVSAGDSTEP